jgi:hypothetical protein
MNGSDNQWISSLDPMDQWLLGSVPKTRVQERLIPATQWTIAIPLCCITSCSLSATSSMYGLKSSSVLSSTYEINQMALHVWHTV